MSTDPLPTSSEETLSLSSAVIAALVTVIVFVILIVVATANGLSAGASGVLAFVSAASGVMTMVLSSHAKKEKATASSFPAAVGGLVLAISTVLFLTSLVLPH